MAMAGRKGGSPTYYRAPVGPTPPPPPTLTGYLTFTIHPDLIYKVVANVMGKDTEARLRAYNHADREQVLGGTLVAALSMLQVECGLPGSPLDYLRIKQ